MTLVLCTRTSARRSRTLMQMHTPTHHARTPGVAEGGSGALLANGTEAFQCFYRHTLRWDEESRRASANWGGSARRRRFRL